MTLNNERQQRSQCHPQRPLHADLPFQAALTRPPGAARVHCPQPPLATTVPGSGLGAAAVLPPWRGGGGVGTPAQESQSSCAERKLRDELERMALKERVSFCVSEKLLSSHTPGARSLPGSFVCCVSDGSRWGPLDDSPNSEKVTGGLGKPPIHYSGVGSSPARPSGHRWSQLRGPTPMSTEAPPRPPAFTPGKAPLGGDGPTPDQVGVGCTCLAEQSHPCLASPRVTCGSLWAQEGHPDLRSPLLQELKARFWFPLRLSLSSCGFSNCT